MSKNNQASYEDFRAFLDASQRNWLCAVHLLSNVDRAEKEAIVHISRGWYALCCAKLFDKGEPLPEPDNFVSSIDCAEICFPRQLSEDAWKRHVQAFEKAANEPPWELDQEDILFPHTLRLHCVLLESSLESFDSVIRRRFCQTFFRSKKIRKRLVLGGSVLAFALLSYWTYVVIRGPAPWRAVLYDNVDLSGPHFETLEHEKVDFDWRERSPLLSLPSDNFSVRWDSCLRLEKPTKVSFVLGSDDGSRLKVDGKLVIDHWAVQRFNEKVATAELPAGMHHLQVDYYELSGGAQVRFSAHDQESSEPLLTRKHLVPPVGPIMSAEPCVDN